MAARYDVESISDMMEGDDVEEPESGQGPSGFLACTGCVAACTKALRLKTICATAVVGTHGHHLDDIFESIQAAMLTGVAIAAYVYLGQFVRWRKTLLGVTLIALWASCVRRFFRRFAARLAARRSADLGQEVEL